VADGRGGDFNFHLARLRRVNVNFLNDQWLIQFITDRGFHFTLL
jgi:hypothetical protein